MNSPSKVEPSITEDKLSEEEQAWWRQYTESLTPEDFEEMRQVTDVDVMARLQAHIAGLKANEAKQAL